VRVWELAGSPSAWCPKSEWKAITYARPRCRNSRPHRVVNPCQSSPLANPVTVSTHRDPCAPSPAFRLLPVFTHHGPCRGSRGFTEKLTIFAAKPRQLWVSRDLRFTRFQGVYFLNSQSKKAGAAEKHRKAQKPYAKPPVAGFATIAFPLFAVAYPSGRVPARFAMLTLPVKPHLYAFSSVSGLIAGLFWQAMLQKAANAPCRSSPICSDAAFAAYR
jgi:hypothetical protein